jgi:hypothetical protein
MLCGLFQGAGKKTDQGGSYLHKAIYDLQQSSDYYHPLMYLPVLTQYD